MDQSISIPYSLVLRSLPVNVELLDLIKQPAKMNVTNISEIRSEATPRLSKASEPSPMERRKDYLRKKIGNSRKSISFKSTTKSKIKSRRDSSSEEEPTIEAPQDLVL